MQIYQKVRTRKRWLSPSDGWWNILSYIFLAMDAFGRWVTDSLSSPESNHQQNSTLRSGPGRVSDGVERVWDMGGILFAGDINKQLHHSLWSCPFHWWLGSNSPLTGELRNIPATKGAIGFASRAEWPHCVPAASYQSAGRPLRHLPSSSQPCAGAVSGEGPPPSWPHHCEWSGPREAFACTLLPVHKIRLDSKARISKEHWNGDPSALDWMLPIIFMNSSEVKIWQKGKTYRDIYPRHK